MELKQLQLEILEAERLIERNKMILSAHMKMEEMAKLISQLQQTEPEV